MTVNETGEFVLDGRENGEGHSMDATAGDGSGAKEVTELFVCGKSPGILVG